MAQIRKAVFPVAGLGTRFLPATKSSPKEMLPVVDKPLIQYAVEEAAAAGITEMIFITGRGKRSIEDHFDKAYELEAELAAHGKTRLLEEVRNLLPRNIHYSYVRQVDALGLGHAVLCARPLVNDEPFAVVLADDLVDAEIPVLKQMIDRYQGQSILGLQNVARNETNQYGIVKAEAAVDRLSRLTGIVEKPQPDVAPSTLGVVGRYVLTPRIFHHLQALTPGSGGEIQLTDGIASLMREETVTGYAFEGTRYDCGSKLGYLKASVAFALKHPELSADFAAFLRGIDA
ncbi:MAG: UTP--glucose-1-phosphate uridylyltransferase GalU [Burkholderiales bacterium]